jgi:hypothetical protein
MAFEKFFKQPMTEYVLIQKLTAEVRARYQELGQGHYYLRMSKVNEVLTQIEWEHASETMEDHMDMIYESRINRAEVVISFREEYWKVVLCGYWILSEHRIYPDRTVLRDIDDNRAAELDISLSIPRRVIEGGFGDLCGQFQKKTKKI